MRHLFVYSRFEEHIFQKKIPKVIVRNERESATARWDLVACVCVCVCASKPFHLPPNWDRVSERPLSNFPLFLSRHFHHSEGLTYKRREKHRRHFLGCNSNNIEASHDFSHWHLLEKLDRWIRKEIIFLNIYWPSYYTSYSSLGKHFSTLTKTQFLSFYLSLSLSHFNVYSLSQSEF
jgi:hypothetical protein